MDFSTQPLQIDDRTFDSDEAISNACVASGREHIAVAPECVVVERNSQPLTPSEARHTTLVDGDRLEIVRIVAAGEGF